MATHALTIEPDQQALLEQVAASQLRSPEVLVREAVEEYLTRQQVISPDRQAMLDEHDAIWGAFDGPTVTREQMIEDAEESNRDLERTGLHLTHEEVTDWVNRLKHDPNAKLPECHT